MIIYFPDAVLCVLAVLYVLAFTTVACLDLRLTYLTIAYLLTYLLICF